MNRPVLLLDVMKTLVSEAYDQAVPAYFNLSRQELREAKDSEAFLAFEKGLISEQEYGRRYFLDRRKFDVEGLKKTILDNSELLPGIEELLTKLKDLGYPMYALSNYSEWYTLIEEKLLLSRFLDWRFVSCKTGVRKPDAESYLGPLRVLNVEASSCIFVDDREKNIEGAKLQGLKTVLRNDRIENLISGSSDNLGVQL